MSERYIHYLPGGGLGDVYREAYFHNALGILKRWKLLHPTAHLTVLLMSHNPASLDWLTGQSWIDDAVQEPFPLEQTWAWEACYTLYPGRFEGRTELRFVLPVFQSLYRSDLSMHRPRVSAVEVIPPIGMANQVHISQVEREYVAEYAGKRVYHPFAGEALRWVSMEVVDALLSDGVPGDHLVIGGNYQRPGHAPETGKTFCPRLLATVVASARAVIGAESSVYYLASMLGRPFALLYHPYATYAKVLRRESNWDWYFRKDDSTCLTLELPLTQDRRTQLQEWVRAR